MITYYLIRHGIKEDVPFDPPLTEKGKKLAELTSDYLKKINFKAMFASHKLRAQQTAEIIAKPHKLSIITDKRIQERMEWELGKTFEQFMTEWGKTDLDRTYVPEIGDSSVNKGKIMRRVIEEIEYKFENGNIAIVTHGGAIGDLLRNLFPDHKFVYRIGKDSKGPYLDISECSLTVISKEDGKYNLVKYADTKHLIDYVPS